MRTAKMFFVVLFCAVGVLLQQTQRTEAAVIYIYPEVGAFIPTTSALDNSASLGVTGGVGLIKYLTLELEYQRVFSRKRTPAANIVNANGVVRIPVRKIIPYGSLGFGIIHAKVAGKHDADFLVPFGLGVDFGPWLLLTTGIGAEYTYVKGGPDFVLPYFRIGVTF